MRASSRFFASRRRGARGLTLIETMIAMAVGVAVVAVVFTAYKLIETNRKASAEAANLTAIATSLRGWNASSASYSTITNTVLLNAQLFPTSMVGSDGTTVTNVWGGAVSVGPSTLVTNGFEISESSVPQSECSKLAGSVSGSFSYTTINGSQVLSPGNAIAMDTVAQQCASGGANNILLFDGD